jgi:hypothetical protein
MLERARVAGICWGALLLALPALSAACTATANVDDAFMALDSAGDRKRDVFFTDTAQIYCVAEFASSRTDVTVNIKLHQLSRYDFVQNQIVGFDAYPTELEIAPGAAARSKHSLLLVVADEQGNAKQGLPYQAGDYECQVFLDGHLQKSVRFSIQFPPCPDIRILANSTCLGFYRLGDKCPELGAASTQNLSCACQVPCTSNLKDAPNSVDSYAPLGGSCPTTNGGGQTAQGETNLTGGDWKCDPIQ